MVTRMIKNIEGKQVVVFKKKTGCPKCLFLDMAIKSSDFKDDIQEIYLEDYSAEEFNEEGIMSTPVLALVEDGKIVKRDNNALTADHVEKFMNNL